MLIDDLREKLKEVEPDVTTIKNYWEQSGLEDEYQKLNAHSNQEDFWQHPDQTEILKKLQRIKIQREQYLEVTNGYIEAHELLDLFEQDEAELTKIANDIHTLCRSIKKFKIDLLLNEPDDDANCFVNINAGAGGTESQDWANMLLRMYIRFAERNKCTASVVDYQPAEEAGIKSATLFIKGKKATGLLKGEHGVHRLVRISPFDSNKRRHTSFSSVMVVPESEDLGDITIDAKELRIDTYRASGAGGQHVNKTDSAVRITHLPTNIVVQCQNERSQTQNKETAMKMLKAKLAQKQKEEQDAKLAAVEKKKIEWGSQIRSYVLHPYKMVKDHRTNCESPQPDLILDGDLIEFIEQYLIWYASA